MILADKIIELRKKAGLSQDELAEQMDVSRQSISKWEGAQSVPDLNKILKLSEFFGVSTDYLLKDDFEKPTNEVPETETDDKKLHRVSMEEANKFLRVNESSAFKNALGVALCIISPVLITILSELSNTLLDALGTVFLFVMIATAVGLFISASVERKPFRYLTKENIDTAYGVDGMLKEKRLQFSPQHTKDLILGVALCILSVVPASVIGMIFSENDFLNCVGAGLVLLMVGVGVFLIVRTSIIKSGFSKLLEEERFTRERKAVRNSSVGALTGSYWLVVTAGYFAYSFITSNWGESWIIFPIAALLTPVVYRAEKYIISISSTHTGT